MSFRPCENSNRPLSALLSQVLVAFTVEFDNEFERRMAESGYSGARLSLVVWSNLIRFIPESGISVRDLTAHSLAEPKQTKHLLGCLERWGFVVLDAGSIVDRTPREGWGSGRGIGAGWMVRLTTKGVKAKEIWPPLLDEIEQRWRKRFGSGNLERLQGALRSIVAQIKVELPEGLVDVREMTKPFPSKVRRNKAPLSLATLFSQALLAFAIEFERESAAPLSLCANALRVLGEKPIRERDIPLLTGGSPEVAGIGWQIKPYIVVEPDLTARRGKVVRLTRRGLKVQREYHWLAGEIEKRWELLFGRDKISSLRELLLGLFHPDNGKRPLISEGLVPPRGVVRAGDTAPALGRRDVGAAARRRMRELVGQTEAFIRDPINALPHYPMWDMNRGFGP